MFTRSDLTRDLRSLGLAEGEVVMVHASVRAVGEVAGGPDEIHLAIKDALGSDGTLLMYASCPQYVDEVGRGNLTSAQEAEVLDKLPPFNPLTARSARDNGALVELLRTYPGSRVNPHPARFVAWGAKVDRVFARQPWNYAFGLDSPLERFVELDGKILMLGSDHDTVTFLHYAEHIVDIPGKRVARFQVPILEEGRRVWREMEEIDTSSAGAHPSWPERFFAEIVDAHLDATANRGGRVGSAASWLLNARALLGFALERMRATALSGSAISLRP
jgi:aminoglycoside 3-N-acetyltransferase